MNRQLTPIPVGKTSEVGLAMGLLRSLVRHWQKHQQIVAERRAAEESGRLYPESKWQVDIGGGDTLRVVGLDGSEKTVDLQSVSKVVVRTTSEGPFFPDVWWAFFHKDGVVEFPQGATGDEAACNWVRERPGYNAEAETAAMACADDNSFVVWEGSCSDDVDD